MTNAVGMTHRTDESGILRIVFDQPGDRVNLLTKELLDELNLILDDVQLRTNIRGILLMSSKPGMFLAGMDVDQIASVRDSHRAAEAARFGQSVFHKLFRMKIPTACAIGGTCLGGGTELALACSFRIAADDPSVGIGLPEVKLGIIPGFGGTQRLPRLIGLTSALDLILTGRTLGARKAKNLGLIDRVVPMAYLEQEAVQLIEQAVADGIGAVASRLRGRRSLVRIAVDHIGPLRRFVLGQSRKRTAGKVKPQEYPAPFKAIEALEVSMTQPLNAGLDFEARIVGELIPSSTAKNLIWLFRSQTAMKAREADIEAAPRKVRRIAVLGAGIMGGGIAQLAANNDILVRLKDLNHDAILSALRTANGIWQYKLKRRKITPRELSRKMAFISSTLDDTGMKHVDLVVEAVVEDLQVKQQVLASLEQRMSDRAVFASNTSSIPISDIAARAMHPERVVGLHFFNPVHRMPLVEVIAGRHSSPEAIATVRALAIRMGKTPVVVKDGPGFLVNRILTFYMNEAVRLLSEGVRIEAVDRSMTAFGMPMGPFELLDQVGLDTAQHVGEVLADAMGERATGPGSLLETLVSAGRLGKKNERGFYRYRNGRRSTPDEDVYNLIGSPAPRDLPPETLQERMVLTMINEAAICLQEDVVREPRDVDMAMVMGTGFPPFRGGLLRHADSVGIPIVADRLSRLADAQGARFSPADAMQLMVREQRRFYA